jgi:antitoxin component of MazEF toxin-antitoxin module
MTTLVSKVDQSGRVTLPQAILDSTGIARDAEVVIEASSERIVIRPGSCPRSRRALQRWSCLWLIGPRWKMKSRVSIANGAAHLSRRQHLHVRGGCAAPL